MSDAYKYGTIKLSYEYLGDEYSSSHPHKIEMVLSNDVSQEELLERFEGFMKAIGYYFNPSEHLGVVLDDMPYPDEWNPITHRYDLPLTDNEADLYPPVSEEEEKAIEAALWNNAFKKKAEQMGDTIAKEYDANVHV